MTTKMPLFPLDTVLFPGMVLPLHIFEPRYREMINHCIDEQCEFGVVLIEQGQRDRRSGRTSRGGHGGANLQSRAFA